MEEALLKKEEPLISKLTKRELYLGVATVIAGMLIQGV